MTAAIAAFIMAATNVQAGVVIRNYMSYPVYVWNSPGRALGEESLPEGVEDIFFRLERNQIREVPWTPHDRPGTSVKISKVPHQLGGLYQFEYTRTWGAPEIYVEVSDIDGEGAGVAGSAFFDAETLAFPDTDFPGYVCTKEVISCLKGEICQEAYQFDKDDSKIETCAHSPEKYVVQLRDPEA